MKFLPTSDADRAEMLRAPHTTPVRRVDEVGAARNLVLRWRPEASEP